MALLGDMRALGDSRGVEHQKIVDFLVESGLQNIWLVGTEFAKTRCHDRKFNDVEEVNAEVAACEPKGYYILIKGSNGIKLSQLTETL